MWPKFSTHAFTDTESGAACIVESTKVSIVLTCATRGQVRPPIMEDCRKRALQVMRNTSGSIRQRAMRYGQNYFGCKAAGEVQKRAKSII